MYTEKLEGILSYTPSYNGSKLHDHRWRLCTILIQQMGLTQQMPLAFLAQLSWFQTYLFDRTQVVSVNGNSSPPSVMKFGVPQGSVLGPILFVLYTQPLLDIVHHHSMSHHSFSDDNQLYKSGHISQLLNIIQSTQCCISDLKD